MRVVDDLHCLSAIRAGTSPAPTLFPGLQLPLWTCARDLVRHPGKLREILDEQVSQFLRFLIVCRAILPGVLRLQHFGWNAWTSTRHQHSEYRIRRELCFLQFAVKRRSHNRSRIADLHSTADAVRTARPTGVNQVNADIMFLNLFAKQLGIT